MAVRDSDTSLWLHNKLGSNEPWTSGSITAQLNAEVLRNIKECFIDLQTQVKLKLLLSFFHIPKRSIDEVRLTWFKCVTLDLDSDRGGLPPETNDMIQLCNIIIFFTVEIGAWGNIGSRPSWQWAMGSNAGRNTKVFSHYELSSHRYYRTRGE